MRWPCGRAVHCHVRDGEHAGAWRGGELAPERAGVGAQDGDGQDRRAEPRPVPVVRCPDGKPGGDGNGEAARACGDLPARFSGGRVGVRAEPPVTRVTVTVSGCLIVCVSTPDAAPCAQARARGETFCGYGQSRPGVSGRGGGPPSPAGLAGASGLGAGGQVPVQGQARRHKFR